MDKSRSIKGGAKNNKMKKYPKIIDYLESHYDDVYKLIDDLGMQNSLIPRRGGSVTFLIPDKKYIAKIRKVVESDKPEEATDMISSLVLLDLFESPADFTEKQDDIPNALGKKITVKNVAKDKVVVDDGELTVNNGFKPFDRQGNAKRGNLAVWDLKGEIKYEGAQKSAFKYAKMAPKSKKVEGSCENSKLNDLYRSLISEEVKSIRSGSKYGDLYVSPIMDAVARILKGFQSESKYMNEMLKARSLLTKNHVIDFAILFNSPKLFNANNVYNAYMSQLSGNSVDTIKQFFNMSIGDCASCNNAANELAQEADNIRQTMLRSGDIIIQKKIREVYNSIDSTNQMGSRGLKVYPDVVYNFFKENPGSHLGLDERKYFIYRRLNDIKSSRVLDDSGYLTPQSRNEVANEYDSLFRDIAAFNTMDSCKYFLCSEECIEKKLCVEFVTAFALHFPLGSIGSFADESLNDRVIKGAYEENVAKELIDIDSEFNGGLDEYANSETTLSEQTVNELKAYLKANNGKYPDL